MATKFTSHTDKSRVNWGKTEEENIYPGDEKINIGCMQRIATATELMAKSHRDIESDRDWYKKRYEEQQRTIASRDKSIAAYRGQITKLKKKLETKETFISGTPVVQL